MKPAALLTLLYLIILSSFAQQQCTIKGEIIDRDSKAILIHKYSDGYASFKNNHQKIAIRKGKFEYSFSYTEEEAYELIFEDEYRQGNLLAIPFFPTNGVIEFKLHPMNQSKRNIITGGKLNDEFKAYHQYMSERFDEPRHELQKILADLNTKNEVNSVEFE